MLSLPSPHTHSYTTRNFIFTLLKRTTTTATRKKNQMNRYRANEPIYDLLWKINMLPERSIQFNSIRGFAVGLCAVLLWSLEEESLNVVANKSAKDSYVYKSIENNIVVDFVVVIAPTSSRIVEKSFCTTLGNTFHMKFENFAPQRCVHQKWLTNSNCVRSWHFTRDRLLFTTLQADIITRLPCLFYAACVCVWVWNNNVSR